ncbi:hypothetical protein LTR08_008647 [Meristemomyces frigidus]|nr:hypothetical protein LTR08_008647 [Meristemomyces frigidus]
MGKNEDLAVPIEIDNCDEAIKDMYLPTSRAGVTGYLGYADDRSLRKLSYTWPIALRIPVDDESVVVALFVKGKDNAAANFDYIHQLALDKTTTQSPAP